MHRDDMQSLFHRQSEDARIAREARIAAEDEARQAEAEIAREWANAQMPQDIKDRARAWGLEAFITVMWSSAFMAGYREGRRDREATNDDA